jgi:hypothetical protein
MLLWKSGFVSLMPSEMEVQVLQFSISIYSVKLASRAEFVLLTTLSLTSVIT